MLCMKPTHRKFQKVKRMLLQAVLIVERIKGNNSCGSKASIHFSQVFTCTKEYFDLYYMDSFAVFL
ncbi:hypothetical protein Cadr_000010110 [Camelus dromedarius]|uniref:Uncharacterized protein n=1 Tax=Camelus dromedarius TaxID=9838 RepID=A0A5N4DWV1_CAMDR|nr:hypothetical protein Cadr_000010110 [Camelus dromedarius]KAB1275481.1 hypothetical protein Cadr_000010110 [Camelus dromedarius]